MINETLNKVMLAALENLKMSLGEGSDLSYLEDIIDPEELYSMDITEIEDRVFGLRPEKLVVTLEGGLVQSVCSNGERVMPVEVYINNLDTEGADDDEVSVLKGKDGNEWEACLRKESVNPNCDFDIDENIKRIFPAE